MKKLFSNFPIYFVYVVAASYLGLLVMVVFNVPIKFITANEALRSLLFSLTMELVSCVALFVLFRVAGNKYTRDNAICIREELPAMILAQIGNILLNIIFQMKLPGSLHVKYFIDFLEGETVLDVWATHKGAVLLWFSVFSAIGVVFCILGYISGAKKRIAERAELTGK